MLMAAFFHDRLAGLFLNDVGPELDSAGLLRIRSYLGVQGEFTSWEMAVANLKSTNIGFESLTADEWQAFAHRVFKPVNGLPRIDYDPALLHTFPSVEDITAGRVANLWELFGKIGDLPVSVVRGEHSDLLSAATVAAMKLQNAGLDAVTIPQRGHAPFLDEASEGGAVRGSRSRRKERPVIGPVLPQVLCFLCECGLGLARLVLHAASSEELAELFFLARRQELALFGPLLALDAAIEFQMVIDPFHFRRCPCRDLVEMEKAQIVQHFFVLRADAADPLKLVGLAAAGR
jgi:hypothetical protein